MREPPINACQMIHDFLKNRPPSAELFFFNNRMITHGEFAARVDLFVRHLIRMDITRGDVVGYTLANSPDAYALFCALAQLGACAVPLFPMIPDAAKVQIFAHTRAKAVVTTSVLFPGLKTHADQMHAQFTLATIDLCSFADYQFDATDVSKISTVESVLPTAVSELPLLVASSSGTTGTPKTVIMTQRNVASGFRVAFEFASPVLPDLNRFAMAFPLSTAGISVCLGILLAGTCHGFTKDVSPVKFMEMVNAFKPQALACPPAYFEAILSLPMGDQFSVDTITHIFTGMDFLSPGLLRRCKNVFTRLKGFGNGYGLIETTNVFMTCRHTDESTLLDAPTSRMSIAANANEICVRDENGQNVGEGEEGELYVKGDNVVDGYVNHPETASAFQSGWFRTGDIVRLESPDTVTLLGRKKYLIKRGGKSVSPIVVQNVINEMPEVKTSAVVGVPHPLYGEMVWAFVVKKPGATIAFKDVMKHCRTRLVNYMVPDQILFIETIPQNAGVGKINYEILKDMAKKELKTMGGHH